MEAPIIKGRVEEAVVPEAVSKDTPQERVITELKPGKDELYATYELDHNAPYIAELFGIEGVWNDSGLSYKKEVQAIDAYLKTEITDKQLDNSITAVKTHIEQMERLAGVSKTAPVEIKMKALASFASHMQRLNQIQRESKWL